MFKRKHISNIKSSFFKSQERGKRGSHRKRKHDVLLFVNKSLSCRDADDVSRGNRIKVESRLTVVFIGYRQFLSLFSCLLLLLHAQHFTTNRSAIDGRFTTRNLN